MYLGESHRRTARHTLTDLSPTADDLYITDVPGKGKGIIALRYFQRGETVLAEPPLFTQGLVRSAASVRAALAQCPPEAQHAFWELHNCHPARGSALGTFETNVLPCGANDAHGRVAPRGGVFATAARLNHGCAPNVNNAWDAARGVLVLRALRDIAAGEELTLGYGALLARREDRRAELRAKFGFECACEVCVLEGKARAASDARRECLAALYGAHLQGAYGDPFDGVGEAALALRLLREEGLPVYESSFCYSGFHCCAAVSDYVSAKAWAVKAFEASRAAFGEEHASYWKGLVANPNSYADAGSLGRRTLAGPDSPLWSVLGF
ncbi:SET domain-containing protein [Phanerochaete sordida]|uniref:SET domain-containing protein n=1 Tax=Phanerochaete sordida TaxID=48140 RepID=A0A9P3FZT9_9APHY|nr:SET domain-containing protein [Phanerochaete sordida]